LPLLLLKLVQAVVGKSFRTDSFGNRNLRRRSKYTLLRHQVPSFIPNLPVTKKKGQLQGTALIFRNFLLNLRNVVAERRPNHVVNRLG
jgi:hypothetical protein